MLWHENPKLSVAIVECIAKNRLDWYQSIKFCQFMNLYFPTMIPASRLPNIFRKYFSGCSPASPENLTKVTESWRALTSLVPDELDELIQPWTYDSNNSHTPQDSCSTHVPESIS